MNFTLKEIQHAKNLFGKDIGWHKKYNNLEKEHVAKSLYEKFSRLEEALNNIQK